MSFKIDVEGDELDVIKSLEDAISIVRQMVIGERPCPCPLHSSCVRYVVSIYSRVLVIRGSRCGW